MGLQARGGIPRARHVTIDGTGRWVGFDSLSQQVLLRTFDASVRLYFTEADFTANANFWQLNPGEAHDLGLEDRGVWMRGEGGTAVVHLLVLHRKG